jgi:hypothetical protein
MLCLLKIRKFSYPVCTIDFHNVVQPSNLKERKFPIMKQKWTPDTYFYNKIRMNLMSVGYASSTLILTNLNNITEPKHFTYKSSSLTSQKITGLNFNLDYFLLQYQKELEIFQTQKILEL